MAYVIAEPCIGTKDTACVDSCPVDCIHPKKDSDKFATEEMLYIDPVECIDCGACVPVCPVSAIFALDDLPEKWKEYTERNAKYFGRGGSFQPSAISRQENQFGIRHQIQRRTPITACAFSFGSQLSVLKIGRVSCRERA